MALESATYINGLVPANPLGSDPLSDADGHLRLVKATLQATFPNITGPVTSTQDQLNAPFPPGGIILWSGSVAAVPSGWLLCDGSSSTPDLRDRFVVGAGSTYAVGATGGSTSTTLSIANLPSHSHGGSTGSNNVNHSHTFSGTTSGIGDHQHAAPSAPSENASPRYPFGAGGGSGQEKQTSGGIYNAERALTSGAGSHSHTYSGTTSGVNTNHVHSIPAEGSGTSFDTRPPYYALAYIMKI